MCKWLEYITSRDLGLQATTKIFAGDCKLSKTYSREASLQEIDRNCMEGWDRRKSWFYVFFPTHPCWIYFWVEGYMSPMNNPRKIIMALQRGNKAKNLVVLIEGTVIVFFLLLFLF
jgi:hypothetical protein